MQCCHEISWMNYLKHCKTSDVIISRQTRETSVCQVSIWSWMYSPFLPVASSGIGVSSSFPLPYLQRAVSSTSTGRRSSIKSEHIFDWENKEMMPVNQSCLSLCSVIFLLFCCISLSTGQHVTQQGEVALIWGLIPRNVEDGIFQSITPTGC